MEELSGSRSHSVWLMIESMSGPVLVVSHSYNSSDATVAFRSALLNVFVELTNHEMRTWG
jgi:hypothetical protein